jgi:hypothetical protein
MEVEGYLKMGQDRDRAERITQLLAAKQRRDVQAQVDVLVHWLDNRDIANAEHRWLFDAVAILLEAERERCQGTGLGGSGLE